MYDYQLVFYQQTTPLVRDCLRKLKSFCTDRVSTRSGTIDDVSYKGWPPSHVEYLCFETLEAKDRYQCNLEARKTYLLDAVGEVPTRDAVQQLVEYCVVHKLAL